MPMNKIARAVALLGFALSASAAWAANSVAYMSSEGVEPWGTPGNMAAMDGAFGWAQWDRLNFGDSLAGYSFIYVDGGDAASLAFKDFVTGHRGELEQWVMGGGKLFLNAATNGLAGETYELLFGATTHEGDQGYTFFGHATNAGHALFDGAGSDWYGSYFAHNEIKAGAGFTTFITGDANETVLAGGRFGNGYVMLGGQTDLSYQFGVDGADPYKLRVNELKYAAAQAVPEPETYALLGAGLAVVGWAARRRQAAKAA